MVTLHSLFVDWAHFWTLAIFYPSCCLAKFSTCALGYFSSFLIRYLRLTSESCSSEQVLLGLQRKLLLCGISFKSEKQVIELWDSGRVVEVGGKTPFLKLLNTLINTCSKERIQSSSQIPNKFYRSISIWCSMKKKAGPLGWITEPGRHT